MGRKDDEISMVMRLKRSGTLPLLPFGDKGAGPWHAARQMAPHRFHGPGPIIKSIHADLPGFLLRRILMSRSTRTV
jgi:hypothetical protein